MTVVDPVWNAVELVEAIHQRQIAEHGGGDGVRNEGLLESALARPQHLFAYGGADVEVPALAASYAYGIARNHPFVDGNKRTGAVICEVFLELNGYVLLPDDPELYPVFLALAAGELEEDQLADWLRRHSRSDEVSEPDSGYG